MNDGASPDSLPSAPSLTWAGVEALAVESPTAAPAEPGRIAFSGLRRDFRRLVMRGALLELVTLGFYRFWLATDMRRHLWTRTSIDGDALEYTGTAQELLIGFLFALAILMPIYLAYFFIGLEAERLKAFASVPLVLFFYLFSQFAVYRARRYRLSRTIWRGVRFWMTGSGWSYAWRAGVWTLLSGITFGLTLPWRHAALERYKMRHSFYGDLPGRFEASGGSLFKRVWWIWAAVVILFAIIVLIPEQLPIGAALIRYMRFPAPALPLIPMLLGAIAVFAWPFVYAGYKATLWRWWVSGLRFGDVRFESRLRAGAFAGLYWKVIGWCALILALMSAWMGGVFGFAVSLAHPGKITPEVVAFIMQQTPVLIGMAIGYVAAALAFSTVVRIYLRRDLWALVVSSTAIHNLSAADNVSARGEAAGALGEGFADSLDIGGF